jgi:Co/Zn/Cd efflux system component
VHSHDLAEWRHDHVFDSGNIAGERGTRLVMWITAVMMAVEIAAGCLYNSVAVWARGLIAQASKVLLDPEMDHPVVAEIHDVIAERGADSETPNADLHAGQVTKPVRTAGQNPVKFVLA